MVRAINVTNYHLATYYIISSFSFDTEQAFFSTSETILAMMGFILRALTGQTETQRIQPMHFDLSTVRGFEESIAPAGQTFAHALQLAQDEDAFV